MCTRGHAATRRGQIEHESEKDHEVKLHEVFAEYCPTGAGWWTILPLGIAMLVAQFVRCVARMPTACNMHAAASHSLAMAYSCGLNWERHWLLTAAIGTLPLHRSS
eukprot:SAG22_NODE_4716_length_1182_cov_1.344414_3_plen_106_part_00